MNVWGLKLNRELNVMKLLLFLIITIILLIASFIAKKRLNVLENIFILLILEFLITGYVAVLFINLKVWEIAKGRELFFIFRVYEVLLAPLFYLWYFNLLAYINVRINKALLTIFFIGTIYGVEFLIVKWKVIIYKDWSFWQSLIALTLVLLITYSLKLSLQKLFRKEGVKS
jgi:hypothetical protein